LSYTQKHQLNYNGYICVHYQEHNKTISVHNQAIKTCTQHPFFYFGDRHNIYSSIPLLVGLITIVIIETKKQKLDPKTPKLDYKKRLKLVN
jgi:hypothetical protein